MAIKINNFMPKSLHIVTGAGWYTGAERGVKISKRKRIISVTKSKSGSLSEVGSAKSSNEKI